MERTEAWIMDAIRDAKKAGLSDAMVANLLLSIFAHVGADAWLSDAACIREVEKYFKRGNI